MQLAERVQREKAAYNEGLQRTQYNRVLCHTHHLYRAQRHLRVGALLRSMPDARMLELGSTAWLHFLEQTGVTPKELTCINISERELAQGIDSARTSRLRPRFEIMDAHALAFPDGSFDVVLGVSILHHLEFEAALREVRRVLKPDGLMVFAEPLDLNPVGRVVRALTPRARTADERPFRGNELELLRRYFACELYFEQLLSVPLGLAAGAFFAQEDNVLTRLALWLDEGVQRAFPALGPYYRHVLIVGRQISGAG